jgi:hypothetical protein
VGTVGNAVMLHARLHPGQRLMQVLALTQSLGTKVADDPETFVWRDEAGDAVRVALRDGRIAEIHLERAAPDDAAGTAEATGPRPPDA